MTDVTTGPVTVTVTAPMASPWFAAALSLLLLSSCAPAPAAPTVALRPALDSPPGVGPRAATADDRALCAAAPEIVAGSAAHGATSAASPRFALHLYVKKAPIDFAKGEGELGFHGFRRNHRLTIVSMPSGVVVNEIMTGVCIDNFVTLPQAAGEHCVIFAPAMPDGYSTFELDYAAHPHTRPTTSAYDDVAAVCEY